MEDAEQNKLFVGGISWETTDDVLNEHFTKYGTVLGSAIAKDRNTGSPRGFAFVTFSESSAVDRALQDSHQILGRTVEVKRAIPRNEQQSQHQNRRGLNRNTSNWSNSRSNDQSRTKKIFVGGLSANLTEEEFRSYFERFGRITDVVVMHDNTTQRPRGFGFITFESEDSVEEVMQKNFHELSGKLVEVKKAIPKDGISTTTNGFNGRPNSERGPSYASYQQGGYSPYDTRFGYFPMGYGNVAGYPYGPGIFGGGYPSGGYGGIGYGLAPVAPRSPWNPAMVGVRGGFLPYGNTAPMYPMYLNGGPGFMGLDTNVYGMLNTGYSGKSMQMGVADVHTNAGEPTSSQTDIDNGDAHTFGAATSKQSKRGNDKAYQMANSS